jgi:hypothetical protein
MAWSITKAITRPRPNSSKVLASTNRQVFKSARRASGSRARLHDNLTSPIKGSPSWGRLRMMLVQAENDGLHDGIEGEQTATRNRHGVSRSPGEKPLPLKKR